MTKRKPATATSVETLLGGAERGRTRVRGFAPWQPRGKSLVLLRQVLSVLKEYRAQLPITVQQIYYRLIGNHGYDKDANARDRLGDMINRARRGRMIPMSAIHDDGGVKSYPPSWRDALHFMESVRATGPHTCNSTARKASRFGSSSCARRQAWCRSWNASRTNTVCRC